MEHIAHIPALAGLSSGSFILFGDRRLVAMLMLKATVTVLSKSQSASLLSKAVKMGHSSERLRASGLACYLPFKADTCSGQIIFMIYCSADPMSQEDATVCPVCVVNLDHAEVCHMNHTEGSFP